MCKQQAGVIRNHENANVCNTEGGEAIHRECKELKLDGGQVHDPSSD
jgi:hypothetical protein